jgi:hypothetical protein
MKIDSPNILSELSVSGSAEISGSLNVLGTVTATTFSGLLSSSAQVSYPGLLNIPAGIVSGSQQLTGSYDQRYVLSGSITQTTWDNIDSKPAGIVSSSAQIQLDQVSGTTFGSADFTFPQDLTVQGRLTAQEFNTEYVSSSIIYESGSTKFGDSADDVHSFTGSIQVFGSITGSIEATRLVLPVGTDLWEG